jgi:hypothetical protein
MSLCSNVAFSLAINENQFGKGGDASDPQDKTNRLFFICTKK